MVETKYWVGFTLIPGVGRVKFSRMEQYFGSLERAWSASATELRAAGLDNRAVDAIVTRRPKIALDAEMEKLERYKVAALTWRDQAYPARLKEIYELPPVLYVRGSLLPEDEWSLAVVGTRHPTYYGREVTEQFAGDLARNKITVISGLARGIDATAHRAALNAGGRTIAVCGCGPDIVYPSDHVNLAREIIEHGALVTEFSLGTGPKAENFPRRNRIMSGLSLGVLVTEAGEASGAMITVRWALEQNREVFAVPGSVLSPASKGPNRLIQEGAKLVPNCNDILQELNLTTVTQQLEMKELLPVTGTESVLLKCLTREPIHIDELGQKCAMPISEVNSTLTMMELKGIVKQVGSMNYVLARESGEEYKVRAE